MKKKPMRLLPLNRGIFALTCILLLLSPASGSALMSESRLTGSFYGTYQSQTGVFLTEAQVLPLLIIPQDLLLPYTGSREGKSKHIERISPFLLLTAGVLAGFNPCLLAVMAFLASVTLAQHGRRREMLEITLGFSAGIFTMYMLAGLGILSVVNFLPEIQESFITVHGKNGQKQPSATVLPFRKHVFSS
jgi:cytochrome c-type biogenesis protein